MKKKYQQSASREPIRVNFVSLGCPKNLVDSEKMLALVGQAGMAIVGPDDAADVTIINTCGFIKPARDEAFEAIDAALAAKREGLTRAVVVAGCLAQHVKHELLEQRPEIDALVGLGQREGIAQLVQKLAANMEVQAETCPAFTGPVASDRVRLRLTEPSWAYLRISEGCDLRCSFCTIPSIRGPYRSKDLGEVLAEARELVADGAVELNLIGQETTSYGSDRPDGAALGELLYGLEELDHLRWVRVLYTHPASFSDAIIEALASCKKVVPYLDIPLQHINDRILKLMNRHINRRQTEDLLARLRGAIPELAIRTTMLVGFADETDGEFSELLDFVGRQRFEALGAFAYSPEAGTAAARYPHQTPDETKQERYHQIMQLQQDIAFAQGEQMIGKTVPCLLLRALEEEEVQQLHLSGEAVWFLGRHHCQAPEIDAECYVQIPAGVESLEMGVIHQATITDRLDYDLVGVLAANYDPGD